MPPLRHAYGEPQHQRGQQAAAASLFTVPLVKMNRGFSAASAGLAVARANQPGYSTIDPGMEKARISEVSARSLVDTNPPLL